jgi:hypothetical protein
MRHADDSYWVATNNGKFYAAIYLQDYYQACGNVTFSGGTATWARDITKIRIMTFGLCYAEEVATSA